MLLFLQLNLPINKEAAARIMQKKKTLIIFIGHLLIKKTIHM